MEERYYFTCTSGTCTPEFMVAPVKSSLSTCTRRDQISAIPPGTSSYLIKLITASQPAAASGIYALRFRFRWWEYQSSNSFERFEKNLLEQYVRDTDHRDLDLISIDEVADVLNRYTNGKWITLEPAGRSVQLIRREILEDSERKQTRAILREAGCWAAIATSLGVLAYSVFLFRRKLVQRTLRGGAARLIAPLALQVALLASPVLVNITWGFECGLLFLLWPLLLLAWLVEGVWSLRRRRYAGLEGFE